MKLLPRSQWKKAKRLENNTLLTLATLLISGYSLYIYFSNWFPFALSYFPFNAFDIALRFLSHYYMKNGFIPYREFGVIYPPGQFLLIGNLLPFTSVVQRNFLLAMFVLTFLLINSVLLYLLSCQKRKALFNISFFLLLNTFIIWKIQSNPLSIPLLTLLILLSVVYLLQSRKKTSLLPLIFIIPAILVFFRWERITQLVLIELITLIALLFWGYGKDKSLILSLRKLGLVVVTQILGLFTGFLSLFLYLARINAVESGVDFIFTIPTSIILEYRKLPLPKFQSLLDVNFTFYGSLFVFLITAISLFIFTLRINNKDIKIVAVIIMTIPLFMLPYAVGRADWYHAMPFAYFTGLTVLLVSTIFPNSQVALLLFLILFSPHYQLYLPDKPLIPKGKTSLSTHITDNLRDCKEKVADIADYQSLFVGRVNYNKFLWNIASLYLINPNVKPATAFISEEPGLQNSCHYGNKIVAQLERAKKPILTFLDTSEFMPEPNKTQTMTSCGKIETFLEKTPYVDHGECWSSGRLFKIRIYL